MADTFEGMSDLAIMDQVSATAEAAPVTDTADETPVVSDSIDAAIAAEQAADKPATDVAAKPADAVTPPAVDPTKPVVADATPSDVDLTADDITVKSLNERITNSPEFKALMDKDPELKKQLFYAARRAERSNQYDEIFQTPALAKEVKARADDYFDLHENMNSNPEQFLQQLFTLDIERGEDGKMLTDPATGMYKVGGRFDAAMGTSRNFFLSQLGEMAVAAGDGNFRNTDISGPDLAEAVRILQEVQNSFGYKTNVLPRPATQAAAAAGAAPAKTELPQDVRDRLARLDQIESQRANGAKQSAEQFNAKIDTAVTSGLRTDVETALRSRLPQSHGLTDYTINSIVRDTLGEINKLAQANRAHTSMVSRMRNSQTRDDAGIQKVVDFERNYAKEIYPRILAKLLSENTKSVVATAAASKIKVAGQQNRREIETSGGVSAPSRPDVKARAGELLATAKKSGKTMSDMELVDALTQ